MSEARINRISNEQGTGGPVISGITTFSGLNYFVPPSGTTAQRPQNCPSGSIRFNTDSAHLEYFDGLQWLEFEAFNNELGVNGALGNRGVFIGGVAPGTPGAVNTMDYITISTLGNALDFGDLLAINRTSGACASSTRGLNGGGSNNTGGGEVNTIEYITISSTGNSQDFGDLTQIRGNAPGCCSNSTRGVWAMGYNPSPVGGNVNTIDYATIASTGNAVDFGDTTATGTLSSGFASSTRGIFNGGYGRINCEYITISTTGNASIFGNLSTISGSQTGCSNSIRGLFGTQTPAGNVIEFITIATLGNAQDFGDLTNPRRETTAASSPTRGVFAGGYSGGFINIIDFVTIMSTGNALDFGDLSQARRSGAGLSNGHGGL